MIVCTPDEASTKYCCMMPKRCHGDQCMAWNELGNNGFCGATLQPEIGKQIVTITTVQDNAIAHELPGCNTDAEKTSHLEMRPEGQVEGSESQLNIPIQKHNKHKGSGK